VEQSESDKTVMESLLNKIEVKAGDVFLVPARMVHAIGAGCLILEIQEPTDFTIQPECWCGDYRLDEKEMYIGLEPDVALDVFDYEVWGDEAVAKGKCEPRVIQKTNNYEIEELIGYEDTPCFAVQRHTIAAGGECLVHAPAVYVVTDGQGELVWEEQKRSVKKGDYFFLPYAAQGKTVLRTNSKVQTVICLPPDEH